VALDWALGLEYVPLLQDALKLSRKSSLGVFGEITPRLRFGFEGHWQLGPVLKIVVAKDPTFARYSTAEQFFLTQSGVQFIYDIPFARKYLARLELQTLFDMNVPTRKIWAGVLGFQIGYLSENFTDRDYAQLRQEEKKVYIDYEDAKSEEPENQFVKLTLRSEFLKFSSGQSKLSEESKLYLYRLAYVLNTNAVYWKKLEIHGYIDDSAMERNQASLSLSRAESVQRLLLQGGVAPHKMKSFGDGVLKVNSKKIDKNYGEPSALKDNNERRVELIFRGVLDNDKFQSQLKQ
jgi:outer membrane protein OmpA-like peptidoglycan-associated protein